MKSYLFAGLMSLFIVILFNQCVRDDLEPKTIEKFEVLDKFLWLYYTQNPVYELYESGDLNILACEEIILELQRGKVLDHILLKYISNNENRRKLLEFSSQSEILSRKLRRYSYISEEINSRVKRLNSDLKDRFSYSPEIVLLRSSDKEKCYQYCQVDYNKCMTYARQDAALTAVEVIGLGIIAAPFSGGGSAIAAFFIGAPFAAGITYMNERNHCIDTYNLCTDRCENALR